MATRHKLVLALCAVLLCGGSTLGAPVWAEIGPAGLVKEKEAAAAALKALEEKDLAAAARILGLPDLPEADVESWSKAAGSRVAALTDLHATLDEAERLPPRLRDLDGARSRPGRASAAGERS
jgi:hypothetical protein